MGNTDRKKEAGRRRTRRLVGFIRGAMKLAAPHMVDMSGAEGRDTWFETDAGRVRALTYGFDEPGLRPLLVNIHGSGFTLGSAAMDDPFMQQFVDNCGVRVINIDYTLAPEAMFPVALEQCYAVIRYAKANAAALGIDPERIVIMGHSAGGNFCAGIGLLERERKELGLRGIVLDYPPMDIATDAADKPRPKGALPVWLSRIFDSAYCLPEEKSDPLVSPALASGDMVSHFPPTLIITAGRDSLAAEAERFKDTLIAAGIEVSFRRFDGAIHGFTMITERLAKKFPEINAMSKEAWQLMMDFVTDCIAD